MSRPLAVCLAIGLVVASTAAEERSPASVKMGKGVVKYAAAHVGKKVGGGECTDLVIAALKSVGAKTTYDYGVSGLDKDYKWGTPVKDHAAAQPGDIVQFRDVVTFTKTVTKTAEGTTTRTMTRQYPHHTAIIAKNLGKGKYEVYEQNSGASGANEEERRKVRENPLDLAGKTKGTVWIYRPVKK